MSEKRYGVPGKAETDGQGSEGRAGRVADCLGVSIQMNSLIIHGYHDA